MNVVIIIIGILLCLCSAILILLVVSQEQKGRGLSGAIGGDVGGMAEGRVRKSDEAMARLTRIFGIAFAVLVIVEGILSLLK